MERAIKTVWLIVTITAIASCAKPPPAVKAVQAPSFEGSKIGKMAVIVQSKRGTPDRLIEDEFIGILIAKGYTIAARSDIKQIMKEMKFQQSGLADKDAAQIGKVLNVPAVIIVAITKFEKGRWGKVKYIDATMGARLISVERTEVLWIGTCSDKFYNDDLGTSGILAYLARNIANSFPDRTE